MPEIRTAEEAADRAEKFLSRYYSFKTLKSVNKEGRYWKLVYDTAIVPIAEALVEITLDASTGDVMGYDEVKKRVQPTPKRRSVATCLTQDSTLRMG